MVADRTVLAVRRMERVGPVAERRRVGPVVELRRVGLVVELRSCNPTGCFVDTLTYFFSELCV